MSRTRSQGWVHAKRDGHANENSFAEQILNDAVLLSQFEQYMEDIPDSSEIEVEVDGSKHVLSIFGDSTTSKVDLSIRWGNGKRLNLSIKKSENGQVWLVSVPRFLEAMEFHLGNKIDERVRIGLSLFIGGSNIIGIEELYEEAIRSDKRKSERYLQLEERQSRLVAQSLMTNHHSLWEATLGFFNTNIELITHLSFAKGLAVSEDDAADIIVYNKLKGGPKLYLTSNLKHSSKNYIDVRPITPGPKNGGSTLLLPTGFLQMHHPQNENLMQFHHQHKKIAVL